MDVNSFIHYFGHTPATISMIFGESFPSDVHRMLQLNSLWFTEHPDEQ